MARSKLLHDLVTDGNLESILMRLKVIFYELDNSEINKWIDNEIEGYKNTSLPSYRIPQGKAYGDYMLIRRDGSQSEQLYKYKNEEIPFSLFQEAHNPDLYNIGVSNGVSSLSGIIKNNSSLSYSLDSESCDGLSEYGIYIEKMKIEINGREILDILSKIKNRLLTVILELEKNFDNIDSLDLFGNNIPRETKKEFSQTFVNIIYHDITDNSLSIGSNNKIKASDIGHRSGNNVD